jgi:hypothetical protein
LTSSFLSSRANVPTVMCITVCLVRYNACLLSVSQFSNQQLPQCTWFVSNEVYVFLTPVPRQRNTTRQQRSLSTRRYSMASVVSRSYCERSQCHNDCGSMCYTRSQYITEHLICQFLKNCRLLGMQPPWTCDRQCTGAEFISSGRKLYCPSLID